MGQQYVGRGGPEKPRASEVEYTLANIRGMTLHFLVIGLYNSLHILFWLRNFYQSLRRVPAESCVVSRT